MADRTSAEIFGRIFHLLTKDFGVQDIKTYRLTLAREVLNIANDYDFSINQMEADDSLELLGLGSCCEQCGDLVVAGETHDPGSCNGW